MENKSKNINNDKLNVNRDKIDEIDAKILDLLNDRAALSLEIRQIKSQQGQSRFSPQRESEIIKRLAESNVGPIYQDDIEKIFKLIMRVMRELPDE